MTEPDQRADALGGCESQWSDGRTCARLLCTSTEKCRLPGRLADLARLWGVEREAQE